MTAEENAKNIAENEARILELEAVVLGPHSPSKSLISLS